MLILIGVSGFIDSPTLFQRIPQTAPPIAIAISLLGLALPLVKPWWRTRRWYKDLYDFTDEMVAYSPLEIDVLDDASNESYNAFSQAYRVKMESIPDEINRVYRNRPSDSQLSERVVESLCNEGYIFRNKLRKDNKNGGINHLDAKISAEIIESASLVIKHQIEEGVWLFRPRKADKLLQDKNGMGQKEHARKIYESLNVTPINDIQSELYNTFPSSRSVQRATKTPSK